MTGAGEVDMKGGGCRLRWWPMRVTVGYGRQRWRHKRLDEGGSRVVDSGAASW